DITIRSRDGLYIGAHRANLGRFSEGFPNIDSVTSCSTNEILALDENSKILQLLMEFMHPQELPDCSEIDFESLLDLAYAAQKYLIFSAMLVCKIREPRFYEAHPIQIVYYALQHHYDSLINRVLPNGAALSMKLEDVLKTGRMDVEFLAAWVILQWIELLNLNANEISGPLL
ncbi:hypothetical protein C8J56DRAFT_798711, partial [Mycena floridula]